MTTQQHLAQGVPVRVAPTSHRIDYRGKLGTTRTEGNPVIVDFEDGSTPQYFWASTLQTPSEPYVHSTRPSPSTVCKHCRASSVFGAAMCHGCGRTIKPS